MKHASAIRRTGLCAALFWTAAVSGCRSAGGERLDTTTRAAEPTATRAIETPARQADATEAPMTPSDISARQARHLLESDSSYTYLDVRSVEEFDGGRPPGAVNIPISRRNAATGQIEPNPDFLEAAQARFARDAKLIVGCQVGGRSARASELLRKAGFARVSNMLGGFGGEEGWTALGYPVERGDAAERSYQAVLQKRPPK